MARNVGKTSEGGGNVGKGSAAKGTPNQIPDGWTSAEVNLLKAQRIVIRAIPVGPRKMLIEVYANERCPVDVVVLPMVGTLTALSLEAEELTKVLLTDRARTTFEQGRLIHQESIDILTLRESMRQESETSYEVETLRRLDSIRADLVAGLESERVARIEKWTKQARGEA